MAQPKLPNLSDNEQALLYQKLNLYNRGRASYKEAGAYLVVLPREGKPQYTLWVYSPLPSRQSIFYLCDLSTDVHEALRMASTLCFYSTRSLYLTEYNAKRMQSRGDDLIPFGKYRGKATADKLVDLVKLIEAGTISGAAGKKVLPSMFETDETVEAIIERMGLKQVSDEGAILAIVQDVIAKNEKAVADFKAGKNVTGFLVGQCMKASKGQGNPQIINKLIAQELAKL